jgi:hypothetical protein
MTVDPNIQKKADDIRTKVYGKQVRESLASGLEEMSKVVVENKGRQDTVESQFQQVIENTTDKDVISAPEIIAARNGEPNLKARLDKEHQQVTAQLAQTIKVVNVMNYGAKGDGITDDSQAIQEAVNEVKFNSGGELYFPRGEYLIDSFFEGELAGLYIDFDNITVRGDGSNATKIKLGNNLNGHVIEIVGTTGVKVLDLRVDGNRSNNVSEGHGIRIAHSGDLILRNLLIEETSKYGIGLQDGAFFNVVLENIKLQRLGWDGIDIKNKANATENIYLKNIHVTEFDLRNEGDQAGIDLRGKCFLSNITVKNFGNGIKKSYGIRFREGESTQANGYGAHFSTLTSFEIDPGNKKELTFGMIVNARSVQIANGVIRDAQQGLICEQHENIITNIYLMNVTDGFVLHNYVDKFPSVANRTLINNSFVRNSSGHAFIIQTDQNALNNNQIRECGSGYVIHGHNNSITGGVVSNFNNQPLDDFGNNNRVVGVIGASDK